MRRRLLQGVAVLLGLAVYQRGTYRSGALQHRLLRRLLEYVRCRWSLSRLQSARDQQIRALLRAALARPAAERASLIAELAGGDEELRRSVEALARREEATAVGTGAAREVTQELEAGALLGHYRIENVLGRGGMGVVYRATDTKLNRLVAIKLISAALVDPAANQRFRTEAQTASSLNHPHIVTVHDVGEHVGAQFIVSELVDGGTLEDWAAATRRRTWRQSVELLIGVADAISAAHAAQVLHRDIKPSNILIGANGYAKLADFGLAKVVDPKDAALSRVAGVTRPGVVVGTVAYMSPEQVAGLPLDARSDVFSFGIVLYELLAGRRPFEGATDLETLKAIAHATPDPLPDGTPEALRIAVEKALEKEPGDRYQTMRELVVDLRRVVRKSGSSQTAVATSDARIVAGVVRRNPLVTVAAAAAVVLAVGGTTYVALGPETTTAPSVSGSPARSFEITQLTTTSGAWVTSPAISPDGRFVVYAQRSQASPVSNSLWVRQIAASSAVEIVRPEAGVYVFGPTVTPDGESVDFIRQRVSRLIAPELWRVSILGGTPRLIAENVWGPVGWAPEEPRMAFLRSDVAGTSQLVVAQGDGNDQQVLTQREAPEWFPALGVTGTLVRPAWSPDGKTIALFEITSGNPAARVAFVDVATGRTTVRDAHGADGVQGLAWLGPSSLVLNQPAAAGRVAQLWQMSYPDGEVQALTNDLSSYVGVDVDAQRRTLVTAKRELRAAVSVGDPAGAEVDEVASPAPFGGGLANVVWDGERLLYDSAINGRAAIAAVPLTGGAPEYLLTDCSGVAATVDGNTIVCERQGDGLWRADGRGGGFRRMLAGNATRPLVLPDDQTVLFLSSRSGTPSLWTVPIGGGDPTQLADASVAGSSFDVSRDGRRLVFQSLTTGTPLIVVCDMPDCGNRRTIQPPPNAGLSLRWSVDGEHLMLLGPGRNDIVSLPLDGGEPSALGAFTAATPGAAIVGFDWSRDGTRIAIVHTTLSSELVVLNLGD